MKTYADLLKTVRALRTDRHNTLAATPDATGEDDRELKLLNLMVRTALQLVTVSGVPDLSVIPVPSPMMPLGTEWRGVDNTKPCPDGFCMTGKHPASYGQFTSYGWTDADLIVHGCMAKIPDIK